MTKDNEAAHDPLDIPAFLRNQSNAPAADAIKAKPADAPKENDVKKATTTKARKADTGAKPAAKPAKAKTSASANARTPAAKPDVVAKIAAMMSCPEGASMAEMVKATGIEAHPMRAKIKLVRDRLGYATEAPGKDNEFRYHAKPPKGK